MTASCDQLIDLLRDGNLLTPEQYAIYLAATGLVQFVDPNGFVYGTVDKTRAEAPSPEEIAAKDCEELNP